MLGCQPKDRSSTLRSGVMKDIPLEQLKQEIPLGIYCYEGLGVEQNEDGKTVLKTKRCPYWSINEDHEYQDNGYCSYLELGDWMDEPINTYTNTRTGEKRHIGLLWDQVKACGINDYEDEEND